MELARSGPRLGSPVSGQEPVPEEFVAEDLWLITNGARSVMYLDLSRGRPRGLDREAPIIRRNVRLDRFLMNGASMAA